MRPQMIDYMVEKIYFFVLCNFIIVNVCINIVDNKNIITTLEKSGLEKFITVVPVTMSKENAWINK